LQKEQRAMKRGSIMPTRRTSEEEEEDCASTAAAAAAAEVAKAMANLSSSDGG